MTEVIEDKMKAVDLENDESGIHDESPVDMENDDETLDGGNRRKSRPDHPPVQMVLKRGASGSVKWFSSLKGYGFINRDDAGTDVFFHASSIIRFTQLPLFVADGTKVEFDVIKGFKGAEAVCVSGPEGTLVGKILYLKRGPFFGKQRNNNGHSMSPRPHRRNDDKRNKNVAAGKEQYENKVNGNAEDKSPKNKKPFYRRKRQARSTSKGKDTEDRSNKTKAKEESVDNEKPGGEDKDEGKKGENNEEEEEKKEEVVEEKKE